MPVRFPRVTGKEVRAPLHRVHRTETVRTQRPAHLASVAGHPQESIVRRAKPIKPHRIFTIAPRDLLAPDPLQHARAIGWQSLDLGEGGTIATRRVARHPETGKAGIVQVNRGWLGPEIVAAMATVQKRAARSHFEFRVLMLAPLYTTAVWLHRKKGGDVIVPLPPCDVPVQPHQACAAADFFKLARPLAEKLFAPAAPPHK